MAKRPPHVILGVHITDRLKKAQAVQKLLGQFGNNIRTRLGLHQINEGYSAPGGVLVLEMSGPRAKASELAKKLNAIAGVHVKMMVFSHEAS